jgi:formylglycine-generating enzyme required for sulfatase activity
MAAAYCNWLSKEEGIHENQWCYEIKGNEIKRKARYLSLSGYRLPTEAEMEFATRAGAVTSRYYGESGELLGKYAWYSQNAEDRSQPVGSKKPNDLGLFDMHGNVWCWCQERHKEYPHGQGEGEIEDDNEDYVNINIQKTTRALRGGSFFARALDARSASRYWAVPPNRNPDVGFRPARTFPCVLGRLSGRKLPPELAEEVNQVIQELNAPRPRNGEE